MIMKTTKRMRELIYISLIYIAKVELLLIFVVLTHENQSIESRDSHHLVYFSIS